MLRPRLTMTPFPVPESPAAMPQRRALIALSLGLAAACAPSRLRPGRSRSHRRLVPARAGRSTSSPARSASSSARSWASSVDHREQGRRQRRHRRGRGRCARRPTAARCGSPASARRRSTRRSTTSCPTTRSATSRRCRWWSTTSSCWWSIRTNPATTAAEFVAASKKRRSRVSMASSGIGSIPHLAIEQLADATGAKLLHVPYKGAAPAITDVLGGQVGGFFGDIPGLIGYVQERQAEAARPRLGEAPSGAARGEDARRAGHRRASTPTTGMRCSRRPRRPPATIERAQPGGAPRAGQRRQLNDRLLDTGAEPAPSTPQELAALLQAQTPTSGPS